MRKAKIELWMYVSFVVLFCFCFWLKKGKEKSSVVILLRVLPLYLSLVCMMVLSAVFYSDIHYWWKLHKINIFEKVFCTNLSSRFLFWEKSHIHILCLFVSLSFVCWRAAPQCRRQWLECLRDFNTRRSKITH